MRSLAYLGAECLTAGSPEPSGDFLALTGSDVGQAVRRAVQSRFVIQTPQSAQGSDDELLAEYMRAKPTSVIAQWVASGKISRAQALSTSDLRNYTAARRSRPNYASADSVLDRIVAVYLQWTWVAKWNNRTSIAPEEIIQDPCLAMAVMTVAPMSEDKGPGTPVNLGLTNWLLIGGAVVLGGMLLYALAKKRKKSGAAAGVLPLALPAPLAAPLKG